MLVESLRITTQGQSSASCVAARRSMHPDDFLLKPFQAPLSRPSRVPTAHISQDRQKRSHYGRAQTLYAERARVLAAAFHANPERFVRRAPLPPRLPSAVWINEPKPRSLLTR